MVLLVVTGLETTQYSKNNISICVWYGWLPDLGVFNAVRFGGCSGGYWTYDHSHYCWLIIISAWLYSKNNCICKFYVCLPDLKVFNTARVMLCFTGVNWN